MLLSNFDTNLIFIAIFSLFWKSKFFSISTQESENLVAIDKLGRSIIIDKNLISSTDLETYFGFLKILKIKKNVKYRITFFLQTKEYFFIINVDPNEIIKIFPKLSYKNKLLLLHKK